MSTDANIEFTGRYPAEVAKPGLIGVQGRAFVDLVRQLPTGVLHLTLDEASGNLLLEQGRRTYKLPVSGAEWFQNFSSFPTENAVTWSGDFLQDVLDKVSFCISDDDAMEFFSSRLYRQTWQLFDELRSQCGGFGFTLRRKDGEVPAEDMFGLMQMVLDEARKGINIQRYKGLGEMNPDQLWVTTMNPENRVLLQVSVDDANEASDAFQELMGDRVEPRRDFIERNALAVQDLDI
jgi:Type IIA topoisomerase (DNA gyrase/topo II, topoisomerase IV), B subunit